MSARWKIICYLAALFVAGAICGASVMARYSSVQSLKVGRSEEIGKHIKERLQLRLDLTSEQLKKLAPLIKKTSEEIEASHLECLNKISAVIDGLHTQVPVILAEDLSPEQKKKLAQLHEEKVQNMQEKYNYTPPPVGGKPGP